MSEFKVVPDLAHTDARYQLPPSLQDEYEEILELLVDEKPVIHRLKEFHQEHPAYPQAGNMLAAVYLATHRFEQSWQVNEQLLERFPDYPTAVLFKAKMLLDQERFEELEDFVDLDKDFGEQFEGRHLVSFSELAEYESVAIEWQLANSNTSEAVRRSRAILLLMKEFKTDIPFPERVLLAFETFLPVEELTLDTRALLSDLIRLEMGYPRRPDFHHPEINLLYEDLEAEDVPRLLALLNLPRTTLLQDLRATIRDGMINYYFFRAFYGDKDDEMNATIVYAFLLLAELREPGDLADWLQFLHQPEDRIDWWVGDWMGQMMFVVGWQLGRDELPRMEKALLDEYKFDWASPNLVTSMGQIALTHPEKTQEVLDIFYRVLDQAMNKGFGNKDLSPFLIDTILENACRFDLPRFLPMVDLAYANKWVDDEFYGSKETFLREIESREDMLESFEYKVIQQGLSTWLTRVIMGEL